MRSLVFALSLAGAAAARPIGDTPPPIPPFPPAGDAPPPPPSGSGVDWAVLIAGSNTWGNYRHQADIFHAYQILIADGVSPDNIVTLAYDDLANNPENPHPGTVINNPDGKDVYAGVAIDYKGADLTAATMLAVIKGDKAAVAGKGTGRVLDATSDDHVFIYYADHGGPGILGVPEGAGPYLYAKDLNQVILDRANAKGFGEMTFYLEACESGSIFKGQLPDNINVYAVTAANDVESSWGFYCPGMDPPPPSEYNTCLGDLFSISWLENADASDLTTETLEQQYKQVKVRTSNKGTYEQGSHVTQFGDVFIANETCSDFMGDGGSAANTLEMPEPSVHRTVSQRDADLHSLWYRYVQAPEGSEKKSERLAAFNAEVNARATLDANVEASVRSVMTSQANAIGPALDSLVTDVMTFAPEGEVVDDWDCFKAMVSSWENGCGKLSQYGMKHARSFANLCNRNILPATLERAATRVCQGAPRVELTKASQA